MVFWVTYPFSTLFYRLCTKDIFRSLIFTKDRIILPDDITCTIYTTKNISQSMITKIQLYLQMFFGDPPHTPILDIPEEFIITPTDFIIVLHYNSIIGTIRYHYMGEYINKERIYCVDCFCIHPEWRKKGLGDFLLTELHSYANQLNIPYCMFLKEGTLIQSIHFPLYSSTYVYRKISENTIQSLNIYKLSVKQAHRMIDRWLELYPTMFVIRTLPTHSLPTQQWRLYKKGMHYVLACIQNTFQKLNNNTMGWITAWLESPCINDTIRKDASEQISASNPFDYIWLNKEWIGTSTIWTNDGTFHWYSYQWTTGHNIGKSYCILI